MRSFDAPTRSVRPRELAAMLGDWRGSGHHYVELSEGIELLIRDGRIAAGAVLPAERPLAEALAVSRTTVSATYELLREAQLATSRQGSGTVVSAHSGAVVPPWVPAGNDELDLSHACPEPWHGLRDLHERAIGERPDVFAQVGFDTIGDPRLRAAIAERYSKRGLPTTPEQVMVTSGAQHAVFLVARTLLGRGDRSLIESPSYPYARDALAARGALVAELPVGVSGYEAAAALDTVKRTSPRLAYLIPDHHNPTGLRMADELKTQLTAALAASGSYAIVDETTAELSLTLGPPITPFAAYADRPEQQERLITVGSLSKTVWGGLRVGWIRANPQLIAMLEVSRRIGDLGTGSFEQAVAALAFDVYDEILATRTEQLADRHGVLQDRLAALAPEWKLSPAEGGLCVWVDLGARVSSRLSRAASDRGVRLVPGARFGSPETFERFVRVPYSLPVPQLSDALERLGAAWQVAQADGGVAPRPAAVI